MSSTLGGVEKQIVKMANTYNVPTEQVIQSYSYSNDLKVECFKLLHSKNAKTNPEVVFNCASKFQAATKILDEISSKINL